MIHLYNVKKYCKEDISKIKNFDKAVNDTTQVWDLHHMTETWWNCTAKELIENECYYNRKACELVFLTHAEHSRLHMKGKQHTEEHRRKFSESMKGHIVSEDTRKKLSVAKKGIPISDSHRRNLSESHKGKHWKLVDGKRVWYE